MDYAIGDIQGCYQSLMTLLEKLKFDAKQDRLWLVGDLVNRGPDSLAVLRFLKSLENKPNIVWGNHDLHLLAVFFGEKKYRKKKDSFMDVLQASDGDELCHWLLGQHLAIYSKKQNVLMTHAGVWPHWTLEEAISNANEAEAQIKAAPKEFFRVMYGDMPAAFSPSLDPISRARFIVNAFTRMRYCFSDARLELTYKAASPLPYLHRWFELPSRKELPCKLLFGHWASLNGEVSVPRVLGLDTGCVWGGKLTAFCLQTEALISV
jgi:bis(5'-nucleosyl)-tetraphosphatase (symmetrical)